MMIKHTGIIIRITAGLWLLLGSWFSYAGKATVAADSSGEYPPPPNFSAATATLDDTVYGNELSFNTVPLSSWSQKETPDTATGYKVLPVAGIDIVDLATNGDTIYAATNNVLYPLFKSTDGGSTWSNLKNTTDFPVGFCVKAIAVATDDADTVAFITSNTDNVCYSSDGGASWSNLYKPSGAGTLRSIDVSPGATSYIAVGGNSTTGDAAFYTMKLAVGESWEDRRVSGTNDGFAADMENILAVKFSPNYITDEIITAISVNTSNDIAYFEVFWYENGKWNTSVTAYADYNYPVTIGDATDPLTNCVWADIALTDTYLGTDEYERTAFVSVAGATDENGLYRLTDDAKKEVVTYQTGVTGPIYSVAYHPDGKLLAGDYDENKVYMLEDAFATEPRLGRLNTLKPPSGVEYVTVEWAGDNAVAATSGDESAFSVSTDDGYSFNDTGLIDTEISVITDFAVNADGSKVYLASYDGDDVSLWLKASSWKRILSLRDEGSLDLLVRIAPDDDTAVYIGDTGSRDIWISRNSGQESWKKSTCYKLNGIIRDMAVESADVAYVICAEGISKTNNAGTSWDIQKRPYDVFMAYMITLAPNGDILIGGSDGYIAYSKDGGATYERTAYIGPGNIQVVADEDYATNNIIYAGAGTKVYQGYADTNTAFTDLSPSVYSTHSIVGMVRYENIVYVLSSNTTDSALYRALNLKMANTPGEALWSSSQTVLEFEVEPQALKVSFSSVPILWAVDTPAGLYSFDCLVFKYIGVATSAANYVTNDSAVLQGNLYSLGGDSSANVSFEWGTVSGNLTGETVPQVKSTTGNFSASLSGLSLNTTYYFRAKVAVAGPMTTEYGNELSFITVPFSSWSQEDTPDTATGYKVLPVAGIDIVDLAVNGDTIYAATNNMDYPLFRSTDGGTTWANLKYSVLFTTAESVKAVAVAPDDASQVAVITGLDEVQYSSNSGDKWSNLYKPSGAETLSSIDISPGATSYIAVGGNSTAGDAAFYTIKLAMAETWEDRRISGSNDGFATGMGNIKAVSFSPSFSMDEAIAVVSSNSTSATLELFDYETKDWNGEIDYLPGANWSAGVEIADITGGLAAADIALPTSYNATDPSARTIFAGIAGGTSGGGVTRLDDHIATSFQDWTGGDLDPVGSIAWHNGILLAGDYDENRVYQSDDPMAVSPKFGRLNTLKQPGGERRTLVGWAGDNAVAATSGDESAFAVSTDDGYSFNDTGLIDTEISVITDFAVNAEGSKVYLASYDGNDTSLWLKSGSWSRVLSLRDEGSLDLLVRIAPGGGTVVYLADRGSQDTWVSQNSGQESWERNTCYKLSTNINDLVVESADVAYVIDDSGCSRTSNGGTSWGTKTAPGEGIVPHMITLAPNNDILIGSSDGYVAYSKDSGATWERTLYVGAGNIQVVADEDYAANNIIYAGAGAKVYRGCADNTTGFVDLSPPVYPTHSIVGMARYDKVAYVLSSNSTDSALYRALNLKMTSTPGEALWSSSLTTLEFETGPQALKISLGPILWAVDTPAGLYSCSDITIRLPEVTTDTADNIGSNSATLHGSLSSLGGHSATNVSFQWGTTSGAFDQETSSEVMNATGGYSFVLGSLTTGTTYYFRAKSMTCAPVYGNELSFTTQAAASSPPATGGGGGGGITTDRKGVTRVASVVGSTGVFSESVTARSADSKVKLVIEKGTTGKTSEDKPMQKITIEEISEYHYPPEGCHIIGLPYDIGPDGCTFDKPVTLSFEYDPVALEEGTSEEELILAWWDGENEEWVLFENCTVDTEANIISVEIYHFSVFAILHKQPSPPELVTEPVYIPEPAKFEVSGLSVTPGEVKTSEEVTVSVIVTNTGGSKGSYTVVLTIDGTEEATKEVSPGVNESETVTFTVTKDIEGSYEVNIAGETGQFTVVKKEPIIVDKSITTPEEEEGLGLPVIRWIIGGVIAGCVLVAGIVTYLITRSRHSVKRI